MEPFDFLFDRHVAFAGADVHVFAERDPVVVFPFFVFGIGPPLEVVVGRKAARIDLAAKRRSASCARACAFGRDHGPPIGGREGLILIRRVDFSIAVLSD